MINKVSAGKAPAAIGPYSQAVEANGFLYTSGQIPLVPETGEMVKGGIAEQTERVMQNLAAVLEAAGADFSDAVKTTCFLQRMEDFAAFNEVYAKYFTAKPARSCVAAAALPRGALVEVECVCRMPG